jgi:hypothetical protein
MDLVKKTMKNINGKTSSGNVGTNQFAPKIIFDLHYIKQVIA